MIKKILEEIRMKKSVWTEVDKVRFTIAVEHEFDGQMNMYKGIEGLKYRLQKSMQRVLKARWILEEEKEKGVD